MMTGANPTLRQRQLANRLRDLRHDSNMSIAEVAEALLCSAAKISRIETAQRRASLRDVRDLCRLYGVEDPSELMALAKDAREQGWWQDGEDVDFRPVPGLENDAIAISEFETTTIPGLLQTEDYARAVIQGFLPQIDPSVREDRVAYRMKRQNVLRKTKPPRYWVLLDESALHRHIGGEQTMADQLDQVAEMAAAPRITVQVVPYTVGAHMALDSAFMLLEFDPSAGVADTVYMDTLAGQIFQEKPAQLARFREVLNQLRAVALSPKDSIALVRQRSTAFKG
ncbi:MULTISPECIES: helix-turn-helix domain-containing protein [Nonomuraea]|uniref:Helix-turn-helix transcriptional regulator n=1 Tax=Nonomuraea ferruginea TaxID=46174 RepID=A0ABT4ST18_9ACTN|nr:helix-turn-helix transcriptional regulator [Nonomuraea ferruginea]MDA0640143.1 helix-turn-helix transcriptional regulator [Nonomuraea ferruginea]